MKCCGSPTTSTVDNVPSPARTTTGVVQAMLFGEVLKPLTAALGPVGDTAVGSIVAAWFVPKQP